MCARPFACARPSGLGDLQETVVETVSSAPAPLELQGARLWSFRGRDPNSA